MTTANQFPGNQFLWWLVQNGVTVAVMIPLVMLACRALRNRPAVQHALWVVVLVKFVTPSFVVWPWALPQIGGDPAPLAKANAAPAAGVVRELLVLGEPAINADELLAESPSIVESEPVALDETARHAEFAAAASSFTANSNAGPLLTMGALVLWFVGSGVYAVRQMWRMARHAALVRESSPAPRQLARAVAATARLLRLRPPHAVVAGGIHSPFVWCLGRLRLVWPEEMTGHEAVDRSRGVIAHELAHVRRRDHRVAWLELAAGIVWWWNPLFWLARRRLRESAEMACDALALSAFPEHRRDYAEMLLQLSSRVTHNAPAPVLGIGSGSRSSFERRLSMVLSDRVSGQLSAWGIVAAVLVALVAIPGWSAGQQAAENEASEAPPAADEPVRAGEVLFEIQESEEVKAVSADLTGVPEAKGVLVLAAQLADDDQEDVKEVLRTLLPKACLAFDKGEKVSLKSCTKCHAAKKEAEPAKKSVKIDASLDKREQLYEARMKKLEAAITELHQRLAQEKDLAAAEAVQRKAADEYRTKVKAKLAEPMRKSPVVEPKISADKIYRAKGAQLVPENVAAEQSDVGLKYIDAMEKYKTARAKMDRYSKNPSLFPTLEIEETKIALAGSQKKLEYLASMADLAVEQATSELEAAKVALHRAVQLAKEKVISRSELEELELRVRAASLQLKKAERVRQATSAAADLDDGGSAKSATGKTSALKRPSDATAAENFRKAYSFLKATQDQQDAANQVQNAKAELEAARAQIKELEAEAQKLRESLADPEPAKKSDAPPAEEDESSAVKPLASNTDKTRVEEYISKFKSQAAIELSMNRLKQFGIAMHNYESAYKVLPAAASMRDGKALLSWRVRILPYIEEQALFDKFRQDEPWNSPHNAALIAEMPELYASPQVKLPAGHTTYLAATGKGLVFDGDHATKFSDILDGTSNTIMIVEADSDRAVPWTKPDDLVVDLANPMAGLGGMRGEGFIALFCDGSVQLLMRTIDSKTLSNLFQKADGNPIDRR